MGRKMIDETGNRYGRLTVLRLYPTRDRAGSAVWICRCDCGQEVAIRGVALRSRNNRSCGCLRNMSIEEKKAIGMWNPSNKFRWIRVESRPMDEEERAYYSDDEAIIYCCQLPEHGQEVLVCNRYGHVWIDTFDDDPDYGVGFEMNGGMDGIVGWMPLPEPLKEGKK